MFQLSIAQLRQQAFDRWHQHREPRLVINTDCMLYLQLGHS